MSREAREEAGPFAREDDRRGVLAGAEPVGGRGGRGRGPAGRGGSRAAAAWAGTAAAAANPATIARHASSATLRALPIARTGGRSLHRPERVVGESPSAGSPSPLLPSAPMVVSCFVYRRPV